MPRSLTAIVLLMWIGCYLHCSSEQLGVYGCETACDHGVDCDLDDQPGGGDDGDPAPCGQCDYMVSGGVDAPNFLDSIPEDVGIDFISAQFWLVEPDLTSQAYWNFSPPGSDAKLREPAPRLCELLTCTTVPVRGPSVA